MAIGTQFGASAHVAVVSQVAFLAGDILDPHEIGIAREKGCLPAKELLLFGVASRAVFLFLAVMAVQALSPGVQELTVHPEIGVAFGAGNTLGQVPAVLEIHAINLDVDLLNAEVTVGAVRRHQLAARDIFPCEVLQAGFLQGLGDKLMSGFQQVVAELDIMDATGR